MAERELGLRPPTDDRHQRRWHLTEATMPTIPTPVPIGINWYQGFDGSRLETRSDGSVWIAPQSAWGRVRGGHAITLRPKGVRDLTTWWQFYDQGQEGACVGFSVCRTMTLLNRMKYNGFTVYEAAKDIDEWPGDNYSGTSLRAGLDVARDQGLARVRAKGDDAPALKHGIHANRWTNSIPELAHVLSPSDAGKSILDAGYVQWINSWGDDYPHYVCVPLDALERLLREDGEASVVTDR